MKYSSQANVQTEYRKKALCMGYSLLIYYRHKQFSKTVESFFKHILKLTISDIIFMVYTLHEFF